MSATHLKIRAELNANPGLYGSMTNQQVVDELNAVSKQQNRTSMSGSEVLQNTNSAEFTALTDAKKSQWLALCGVDSIDPFGAGASVAINIFGGGAATIAALQVARVEAVSRASQLGLGNVTTGDVITARAV